MDTALSVDTRRMHYDNLTLMAPFHFRPRDVRRAYDLLCDGRLGAGRLINARRSLSDLNEVFAMLERRRDSQVRGDPLTAETQAAVSASARSDNQVESPFMDQVKLRVTDAHGDRSARRTPRDEFSAKLDHTIAEAQRALLQQQHPEGYWQAALEANAEMNAEYIIFNRFMEVEPDPALDAKLKKTSDRYYSRATAVGLYFRAARATSRPPSKPTSL